MFTITYSYYCFKRIITHTHTHSYILVRVYMHYCIYICYRPFTPSHPPLTSVCQYVYTARYVRSFCDHKQREPLDTDHWDLRMNAAVKYIMTTYLYLIRYTLFHILYVINKTYVAIYHIWNELYPTRCTMIVYTTFIIVCSNITLLQRLFVVSKDAYQL